MLFACTAAPPAPPEPSVHAMPTPTPVDVATLLRKADAAYALGDYQSAASGYEQVIARQPASQDTITAYYRAALAQAQLGRNDLAAARLEQFLQREPDGPNSASARFHLATAYAALGQVTKAASGFQNAALASPLLAGYAALQTGYTLFELPDYAGAQAAFGRALSADLPRVPRVDAMEMLAAIAEKQDDWATALRWYETILPEARTDPYKAQIQYSAANAMLKLGDQAGGRDRLYRVAAQYPSTNYAARAVDQLRAIGGDAGSGYLQGFIYYENDQYDQALAALNGYLVRNPGGDQVVAATYYRALTLRWSGRIDEALDAFQDMIARFPGEALAADALWWSSGLLDDRARYAEAELLFTRISQAYPNSPYAEGAAFQRGLDEFRLGRPAQALETWQTQLRRFPKGEQSAKTWLWIGKLQASAGQSAAARQAWTSASAIDPAGYYGLRATALAGGENAATARYGGGIALPPVDDAAERSALVGWLAAYTGKPVSLAGLNAPSPEIQADKSWQRGNALHMAGLESRARDEFVDLLARFRQDPLALTQLAFYFRDQRLYPLSIRAAEMLAEASKLSVLDLPRTIQRLAFPTYFGDVVTAAATERGIDPLFLFAVIRQESRFDPSARSGVGALGLTQVMPETGAGIAQALKLPQFQSEALLRADLSARFGAYYLDSQLTDFANVPTMALAAYNGGSAMVRQWNQGDPQMDPDLFVENIRFRETSTYVRVVLEQYELYRRVYRG